MSFNFPVFSYIVALITDAVLIFFAIFHVVAFDELRTDYKNPIEQCNSLNPLVLPEYALHMFVNVLFLLSGQWLALVINLPLIAYHINRYRTRPTMSGFELYDPTCIMNADTLSKCQLEGWIKLAFYLITFFYYLYGFVLITISPRIFGWRTEGNCINYYCCYGKFFLTNKELKPHNSKMEILSSVSSLLHTQINCHLLFNRMLRLENVKIEEKKLLDFLKEDD